LLTAGYLGLKSQGAALAFVRGLAACAATNILALAGAELAAASFLELDSQDAATKKLVVDRLVGLIEDPKLPAPGPLRAAAGRVLGQLGDPRPGVGLDPASGLPALAWSDVIEPGPFPMGNDKGEAGSEAEIPRFTCRLITQPYRLSRYPITVAQYGVFAAAGGYHTARFWTPAGWAWRERKGREGPPTFGEPFQTPNHPQVGVSWYEAVAFCRWLSEQTGQDIRLPTEAQWERAARHTDARRYPWADAGKVADRCNVDETGIGSTSAVGLFPAGNAVCGAADLAGNVWEWCSTKWIGSYEGYEKKVDDDLEGDALRVLLGGSWGSRPAAAAAAFRLRGIPYSWNHYIGFRVVVVRSSPLFPRSGL
jgi:formylglycine-generating enzyme required for sulfatase activity